MAFEIIASLNPMLPGAVNIAVSGDPNTPSTLQRVGFRNYTVRNFHGIGTSGLETLVDLEPAIGRNSHYNLIGANGQILAQSEDIYVPDLPSGKALLRSILRPWMEWMEITVVTESDITFDSSSAAFPIEGSPQVTVVGGNRRYHKGKYVFQTPTLQQADLLIAMLRDGVPMLLRLCPGGAVRARDTMFYALGLTDSWWGGYGDRMIAVDYQSIDPDSVIGDSEMPPFGWDFAALSASAVDFGNLAGQWPNFLRMAIEAKPPVTP